MAKWGEIKCPRCAELKAKLNYAVGEWEDYEKTIKQLQAERLANRVAIMRLEAKLAKAVEALMAWKHYDESDEEDHVSLMLNYGEAIEKTRDIIAELTGGTP